MIFKNGVAIQFSEICEIATNISTAVMEGLSDTENPKKMKTPVTDDLPRYCSNCGEKTKENQTDD